MKFQTKQVSDSPKKEEEASAEAISVEGLSVSFKKQKILENVSFTVNKGEIAVLIGPNGSGKSTLLKAMLGIVPSRGEVLFFGEKPRRVFSKIGYVPQRLSFDQNFPITVREFLELFVKKGDVFNIRESLEEVEMGEFEDRKLGALSGGQLQRVLVARAMLRNPELLILDEPTAGIDTEGTRDFYSLIEHVNQSHGATVLLVSHEINVVRKFADRVVCLNRDVIASGDPETVLTEKTLEKLYGRSGSAEDLSHDAPHV